VGREPGIGPAQLTCPNTDTDHSDQSVPVLFAPLFLEGLADSLDNLSVWVGDLGWREDGLVAIQEAADTYRELAARWPDVYRHRL